LLNKVENSLQLTFTGFFVTHENSSRMAIALYDIIMQQRTNIRAASIVLET